jgi:2-polyprenyl-6-methoxyphenol hydroxylase-like FAD-dependent oxidoreductase
MRVAINGAGIAGPTLAYWLQRSGHDSLTIAFRPSTNAQPACDFNVLSSVTFPSEPIVGELDLITQFAAEEEIHKERESHQSRD